MKPSSEVNSAFQLSCFANLDLKLPDIRVICKSIVDSSSGQIHTEVPSIVFESKNVMLVNLS